jgi:integrase
MSEIKVSIINQADREHYLARWTDPITGRYKFETTGETSERKAQKYANKLEQRLQDGTYKPAKTITWDLFRGRFEKEYLPSLAKGTQNKYEIIFNSFESYITIKNLATLNAQHLSRYQTELRNKGLKEFTIKGYLTSLRKALNWAKSQDMLKEVPPINMPKRAKASKVMRGRPITGEEFDRMLSAVAGEVGEKHADSIEYFLNGLWWGGMRLDEALRLTWNHGGFCLVEIGGHYFFRIEQEAEKGATDRLLPVAPQFEQILPNVPPKGGFVFKPTFNRMKTVRPRLDTMSKIIARIGKSAKIITDVKTDREGNEKKVYATAHDLRRAFGTRWAPLVQPKLLMEMMRHSSIETTMKFYVVGNAQQASETLWNVVNLEQNGNKLGNKAKKATKKRKRKSEK